MDAVFPMLSFPLAHHLVGHWFFLPGLGILRTLQLGRRISGAWMIGGQNYTDKIKGMEKKPTQMVMDMEDVDDSLVI